MGVGRSKNPNKNPVAERAIGELGAELLSLNPEGGPVSKVTLALAVANLNARIRHHGLSSREVWTQRDQLTGEQLPLVDRNIILKQHESRKKNHSPSSKSKARGKTDTSSTTLPIGTLVFLKGDKNKLQAREKYLIVDVEPNMLCRLRKFTSSQFRSKIYDVPMSDCYLVPSSVLGFDSTHTTRGNDKPQQSESDSDWDDELSQSERLTSLPRCHATILLSLFPMPFLTLHQSLNHPLLDHSSPNHLERQHANGKLPFGTHLSGI